MKKRMVLKMKFGAAGKNVEVYGVRLYGFFPPNLGDNINLGVVCEAEQESGSVLLDSQHVTFWFQYKSLLPYGKIVNVSKKITDRLADEGYVRIRSSIDNLVDTSQPSYRNKIEAKFPLDPHTGGYNAADGFSVVVQKPGKDYHYSIQDVDIIRQMAIEFGYIVYGHRLKETH